MCYTCYLLVWRQVKLLNNLFGVFIKVIRFVVTIIVCYVGIVPHTYILYLYYGHVLLVF